MTPRPWALRAPPSLLFVAGLVACGGPLDDADPSASASGDEAEFESTSDAVTAAACRTTPAPTMCAAPNTSLLSSCTLAANTPFTMTRVQGGQTVTQSVTCAAGRTLTQRCSTSGNVLNWCATTTDVPVQVTPRLSLTCAASTFVVFDSQGYATKCTPTTPASLVARSYQDQTSVWRSVLVTCAAGAEVSFWSGGSMSGTVSECRLASNTTYALPSVRWQEPIPCQGGQTISFRDATVGYLSACRLSQAWRAQDPSNTSLIRTCPANADVAFRAVQSGLKSNGQPYHVLEPTTVNGQPWTQACPVKAALYTTAGAHTFTVPGSVSTVRALLVGGGGGGGASGGGVAIGSYGLPAMAWTAPPNFDFGGAGGGGGSGYLEIWGRDRGGLRVTPSETLAIVVGAGGSGGQKWNPTDLREDPNGLGGGGSSISRGPGVITQVGGGRGGGGGPIHNRDAALGGGQGGWGNSGGGVGGNSDCARADRGGQAFPAGTGGTRSTDGVSGPDGLSCYFPTMNWGWWRANEFRGGRPQGRWVNGFWQHVGVWPSAQDFAATLLAGAGGLGRGTGGGGGGGGIALAGMPSAMAGEGAIGTLSDTNLRPHTGPGGLGGSGFGGGGGGGAGTCGRGGNGADGAVYLEWD